SNTGQRLVIKQAFEKATTHTLMLSYLCSPKQTVYFLGWNDDIVGNEQIWTQGQGKYTSHWLPSFDEMQEKVEFDINIIADVGYEVIANGQLTSKKERETNTAQWSFDMEKPMSSYLLAFSMGDYSQNKLTSASGIPILNYYYPADSVRVEPTYRYTQEIFDFLEDEIGVPYPWQNYKQIPVRDFLYGGMENTGTTIFSDGYVIDSTAFVDKNYVNVNAHELAHQWFGNLVTEKNGNHHWLHEGFATYYAYLAEKEIFGDEHFYWKLYHTLMELQDSVESGEGQSLIDPKASSLIFYEKGAWALYSLHEQLGEEAFRKGIQNYLHTYQFKNVTVDDFLKEMEEASDLELTNFSNKWLKDKNVPFKASLDSLARKQASLQLLLEMQEALEQSKGDTIDYLDYWNRSSSVHFKQYVLENYMSELPQEIIMDAFASNDLRIRQTLAVKMDSIPIHLKSNYESLLEDDSYVTQENALYKLWANFPQERATYLNALRNTIGLPNKNVRLLWLTLAIVTNDYQPHRAQAYFSELGSYTSPKFTWEVRMGAFQYLKEIGFTNESLKNLMNATVHHSWQFRQFARNLLDTILKDPDYKVRIEVLSKELKGDELRYMNTKLGRK
ncbi:MAG: M1 family metallopeptidase, partial [Pricia sp.]|nr:M1 family metallopeptidase [Pricia sp.]